MVSLISNSFLNPLQPGFHFLSLSNILFCFFLSLRYSYCPGICPLSTVLLSLHILLGNFIYVYGLTIICMLMTSKSRTSAYVFFHKLQPYISNLMLTFPLKCSTENSGLTHPKQNYFLPMWTFSSFHIYSLFQLVVSPFTSLFWLVLGVALLDSTLTWPSPFNQLLILEHFTF